MLPHNPRFVRGILAIFLAIIIIPSVCQARSSEDLFQALARTFAKLPDDVPVKHTDDLLRRVKKMPPPRQADDIAAAGKHSDEVLNSTRSAARRVEVLAQLNKGLASSPTLLRQIDQLDDAGREAALILVKGGKNLNEVIPDIALRGQLVRAGGAELIAGAGQYGDDFVKSALRLQTALDAGAVAVPSGMRKITLADYTSTVAKMGDGGVEFFNKVIQPNWKLWVGTGLFTWWVIDPDGFQDTSGQLVEEGISRIQQLAGEVAASAALGVIDGSGKAVANISEKTWEGFKSQGIAGILGVFVLLLLGSLFFKRVRYYALTPVRWLNREP